MQVIKRDGSRVPVDQEYIFNTIQTQCKGLSNLVNAKEVADAVFGGVHDGITTARLDELAAETAAYMALHHPDYSKLAARIAVRALHKITPKAFSETIEMLYTYVDEQGRSACLIADDVYEFVVANKEALDAAIVDENDFEYSFFGFKTLERSYLLKVRGKIVERPQYMIMRVACGIHAGNLADTLNTYELMSSRFFTHATPTLFNAGTRRPQMSSCFLLANKDDSIDGIFDTLTQCARISKYAGGIGVAMHNVRATGSYIKGTNGNSNGIVPMLRVFNETARYVDQGGGKRKGSIAVYLEPWHDDIMDFIQLRKNHGKDDRRCRDLFQGLWVPDLFMKRVEEDADWTLMCPNECPGLYDVWGEQFEALYTQYEREGRGRRTVKAQNLWFQILDAQIETGLPYLLYKDQCNGKSNQQNIGTIKSSNLCTEILEYTDKDEVAVCNLASLALPKFVKSKPAYTDNIDLQSDAAHELFDFKKLYEVTKTVTRNLNKVIDRNFYPVPEARKSNMRHRPIGLGVQGLADALLMLRLPYESATARALNRHIFETMYFASLEASVELAEKDGYYETFPGSPASKGIFQFDMWCQDLTKPNLKVQPDSGLWDWEGLREKMVKHGMRNSLLMAPMPTASTSQILNNNESFEPYSSNVYVRRVLSGEFIVVNPHLLEDLVSRGLWSDTVRKNLVADNGSVQNMPGIPEDMRELYKTVWEIKQRCVIDMAAERGAFIDQSQSLNLFVSSPNYSKLSSMHFYGWRKGLKTGCYYLRSRAAADPIKFTVDVNAQHARKIADEEKAASANINDTKPEEMKALKAQLSMSLERRTSKLPPVVEGEEVKEAAEVNAPKLSALEEARASSLMWSKKASKKPEPEECTMCSG